MPLRAFGVVGVAQYGRIFGLLTFNAIFPYVPVVPEEEHALVKSFLWVVMDFLRRRVMAMVSWLTVVFCRDCFISSFTG